jgi:hypothetical protein
VERKVKKINDVKEDTVFHDFEVVYQVQVFKIGRHFTAIWEITPEEIHAIAPEVNGHLGNSFPLEICVSKLVIIS